MKLNKLLVQRNIRVVVFIVGMILAQISAIAQKDVFVEHKNYWGIFSEEKNTPIFISYKISNEDFKCAPTISRDKYSFIADPKLPNTNLSQDYAGSGYDKGHMMPAAHNVCDENGMRESFYYTNCTPQAPKLNRGHWKALEALERKWAKEGKDVIVLCGNISGDSWFSNIGKSHDLVVPESCWKIVIVADNARQKFDTICYKFLNNNDLEPSIERYEISYREMEKILGCTVDELLSLGELRGKTPKVQNEIMVQKIKRKIATIPSFSMSKEEIIDRYKKKYVDINDLKKDLAKYNILVPENSDVSKYISNEYDEASIKITEFSKKYIDQISLNPSSDYNPISDFLGLSNSFLNYYAEVCPCCHLPLSFPICLCGAK